MRRRAALGAIVVLAALAGTVIAWTLDPLRASYAWLVALTYGYTVACAALLLLMIGYATDAVWLVAVRRPLEGIAGSLPVLAVLFLPLLFSLELVYPWAGGGLGLSEHDAALVMRKRAWLNEPFFVVRSAIYLVVPVLLAEALLIWSRRPAPARDRAARVLSAAGIPILGFVITFAMIDWLMSLEPTFYSTSFGLLPNAGGFLAVLGVLAAVVAAGMRNGALPDATREHTHALGKLMLTAVAVWAYLAFTHFLIIWIANLPIEVRWYAPRTSGGWEPVAVLLIVVHFALPFALLLSRELKRRPALLAALGLLVAAVHYVHLAWLALPAIQPRGPVPSAADPLAIVAVTVALGLTAALRAGRQPRVPRLDPLYLRSLRYRSE